MIYLNNTGKEYNVGLDIHENGFFGTIMDNQGAILATGKVPYSAEGIKNFLGWLPSTEVIIAIETCGLARGVYKLLTELGYEVVIANPVKTHQIAGNKKTDKVDSETLADLLRTGYLPKIYVPSEDVIKLRDIARHRVRLVRSRTRLQLMIRSYLVKDGKKPPANWNKQTMAWLKEIDPMIENFVNIIEITNEQIKQVERNIKRIAHNKYLVQLLMTIPGIGEFSAILIIG